MGLAQEGALHAGQWQRRRNVVEQQEAHLGITRNGGRVFGGAVVVLHVEKNLLQVLALGLTGGGLQGLHQRRGQGLVHQQVHVLGFALHQGRLFGVAAEHQAAALVAHHIAYGRVHRAVVDREGGDFQVAVFEDDHAAICAQFERQGLAAKAGGRHDVLAMVHHAVVLVLRIGLHKAGHHLLHAFRAMHRHRLGVGGRDPALQHQLAQAVEVVGVKVREEDRLDAAGVEVHLADVAHAGVAGVKHKQALARHHQGAGAAALFIGKRRTGATQAHMQAVRQLSQAVVGEPFDHQALGHSHAQRRAKHIGPKQDQATQQGGCDEKATKVHG